MCLEAWHKHLLAQVSWVACLAGLRSRCFPQSLAFHQQWGLLLPFNPFLNIHLPDGMEDPVVGGPSSKCGKLHWCLPQPAYPKRQFITIPVCRKFPDLHLLKCGTACPGRGRFCSREEYLPSLLPAIPDWIGWHEKSLAAIGVLDWEILKEWGHKFQFIPVVETAERTQEISSEVKSEPWGIMVTWSSEKQRLEFAKIQRWYT